jgi:hypothetical protein
MSASKNAAPVNRGNTMSDFAEGFLTIYFWIRVGQGIGALAIAVLAFGGFHLAHHHYGPSTSQSCSVVRTAGTAITDCGGHATVTTRDTGTSSDEDSEYVGD